MSLDLAAALEAFDRVAVTIDRLEKVWEEIEQLTPRSLESASLNPGRYNELVRSFDALASGLPSAGSHRVEARPLALDDIFRWRFDAFQASIPESLVDLNRELAAPGEAIAQYKHSYQQRRRQLVRRRADALTASIDQLLPQLADAHPRDGQSVADDENWITFVSAWRELLQLVGDGELRGTRATDMSRHVYFGLGGDLHDIVEHDWPSVRPALGRALYANDEPLPVDVSDLDELLQSNPSGPVSSQLNFDAVDADGFERLLFALLSSTPSYEDPTWLMESNAPDRGRDLAVVRVLSDPLTGTRRERIIVQCKHWRRSLNLSDCKRALDPIETWEPPPVVELIIATTGRFTTDAVTWVEAHNHAGKQPHIEMWPNSKLELLLAGRGDLIVEFGLRAQASRGW